MRLMVPYDEFLYSAYGNPAHGGHTRECLVAHFFNLREGLRKSCLLLLKICSRRATFLRKCRRIERISTGFYFPMTPYWARP